VSSAFGDALGGLVSIVAQSAVVTLHPPSKDIKILCVHHERAIRREDSTNLSDASYSVSLGDFYAEEVRDVLIEVTLAGAQDPDGDNPSSLAVPHLWASLAYTDILTNMPARSPNHVVCMIERPANDQLSMDVNYVAKQWIRVLASKEMEVAEGLAKIGQLDEAKRHLQGVLNSIAQAELDVQTDDMVNQLSSDLNMSMNGFSSMTAYEAVGSKNITRHRQTYTSQRMSQADSQTTSPYRTSNKLQMAQKFCDLKDATK
jgi:hypothetical protein